jgi:rare lipoprotein A
MRSIKAFRLFFIILVLGFSSLLFSSCGFVAASYLIVTAPYKVTKFTVKTIYGTGKVIYKIGKFTFNVVKAPVTWPFTTDGLESIDGLSPKEAIAQGRVKMAPYVVNGKEYLPMSLEEAGEYNEVGIASWYGEETMKKKGGHMTANGEAFDPDGLNAAHKYLPLPSYVRVTNLQNKKSIIVRVNDRGPFVDNRIIDLSKGAAKRLGYYKNGTARVLVEAIEVEGIE